jgi:type III restriction enzyme
MFTGKLFDFQKFHLENLLKKSSEYKELVLSAPTGSGKTIIACKFIDDYLDENPNTVFLWLCPGAGNLQIQSQDNFIENVQGIQDGDVYSFIAETDPRGKVYFINWDKINRNSNVVLRDGEHKDLMLRVAECHRNNIKIFMLIDEEHKYQETANYFVNQMVPSNVLRISATPLSQYGYEEKITDDEVIESGLIASSISINEGLSKAIEVNNQLDDDLLLIDLANQKRIAIKKEFEKLGLNINPLVVIQFPNGNPEWINRVKNALNGMGYTNESGLVTSWFSGDHPDNEKEITKLDGKYSFLLFKQAIATGWDCPRAKILVKLREGGNEAFNIQTIGRIRRMPERKHYDNEILDRCYIYTLDSKFEEGLTKAISNSFYSYLYKSKPFTRNKLIPKESLSQNDKISINPEAVVRVLRQKFLNECDTNKDGHLEKKEMELSKGYVFGTKLKNRAFEGIARTTKDISSLNSIFGGEHEINNHDDGFIIRDAKRRIASAIKLEENISNNALKILFGPTDGLTNLLSLEEVEFENKNKLLKDMNLREYNAFLVNNREKIIDLFSGISVNEIAEIQETPLEIKDFFIPVEQYYFQHKKTNSTRILKRNAFEEYGNNILVPPNRSHTEMVFEYWCEEAEQVKFIYKNGDKGNEFFSIVYKMAFRRANFYPDYIVLLTNNDIWIIEAKGGATPEGQSNNIDKYAKNKFEALKDYSLRNPKIKFGFVRAVGQQLYLSNTEWDENVFNKKFWKPIELFIN